MTLPSISLPVHIHDEARHVIYDADGNQVAVCGPVFSELDGSGKLLQQAETIAADLVQIINAHDVMARELAATVELIAASFPQQQETWLESPRIALAAARGEPVL